MLRLAYCETFEVLATVRHCATLASAVTLLPKSSVPRS
jgi:hypothetical protein